MGRETVGLAPAVREEGERPQDHTTLRNENAR